MRHRRYYGRDRRVPPHISSSKNVKMTFVTQKRFWKTMNPMMKRIQNYEKEARVNYIKGTLELIRESEECNLGVNGLIFKLSVMLMEETGGSPEAIEYLTKYYRTLPFPLSEAMQ